MNLKKKQKDNNNKERVTEQVITHWFQNKRKSLRKCEFFFYFKLFLFELN